MTYSEITDRLENLDAAALRSIYKICRDAVCKTDAERQDFALRATREGDVRCPPDVTRNAMSSIRRNPTALKAISALPIF